MMERAGAGVREAEGLLKWCGCTFVEDNRRMSWCTGKSWEGCGRPRGLLKVVHGSEWCTAGRFYGWGKVAKVRQRGVQGWRWIQEVQQHYWVHRAHGGGQCRRAARCAVLLLALIHTEYVLLSNCRFLDAGKGCESAF